MPIRPEDKARYPRDWPAIRGAVLERARHRCEWQGCCAAQYDVGYWEAERWVRLAGAGGYSEALAHKANAQVGRQEKVIAIVLTVAHLDHVPEHCAMDNLLALCQRHHLSYDLAHHQANSQRTRRAGRAVGELF